MGQGASLIRRRTLLAGAAAAAVTACERGREVTGSFAGANAALGHLLRERRNWPEPATSRRAQVIVAGAGIAGLAATRALRNRGIEDFVVLDAEGVPGGNSRGSELAGIACPLGAHYLPLPGDDAPEVQALLEELGLRRRVAGRWVYDERHLCHSPQERLFFGGQWQDGLLPLQGVGPGTLAQYRQFARRVDQLRRQSRFAIPVARTPAARLHRELDALTFAAWLDREGLTDPQLRWYLDYCCRDDYGAGLATVSAWAGIHYFAARHGFHAPGEADDYEAPLTWPEGNAWLARSLTAPLEERFRGGRLVLRIVQHEHLVEVDAYNPQTRGVERWQAAHCIVALPAFIAARVVEGALDFLRRKAAATHYAPWVVANLHLDAPLADSGRGAEPSWDNVVYGAPSLGYVDATHQSLNPVRGATVLTWYHAPGEAARVQLLQRSWQDWRDVVVTDLAAVHPDLPRKLTRIEVARYGHAMAIPVPGALALAGPPPRAGRLSFAHSDWSSYSIFEEAFTLGDHAGAAA